MRIKSIPPSFLKSACILQADLFLAGDKMQAVFFLQIRNIGYLFKYYT